MNNTASHRMFLKVAPNTFNPIMGGFIILKDHKPRGPYKEVIFKRAAAVVIAAITNEPVEDSEDPLTVTFSRGEDVINTAEYPSDTSLTDLVDLLNGDFPAIGTFALNEDEDGINITDPINSDLAVAIVYPVIV